MVEVIVLWRLIRLTPQQDEMSVKALWRVRNEVIWGGILAQKVRSQRSDSALRIPKKWRATGFVFFLSLCKVRFQREQKFKANFESWNIEEETLYPRVDRLIITQQLLCLAECVSNRSSLTAFGLFWKLSVKSKLHFLTWILPLKLCQCDRNSVSFLNVAQPPWGSQ